MQRRWAQVHYQNDRRVSGAVDSSGVKLSLTTTLRKHNAGFLVVGRSPSDPVGTEMQPGRQYTWSIVCKPKILLPITVWSHIEHQHLTGRRVRSFLLHDGQETLLADRDPYDFQRQLFFDFPERVTVSPGDSFRVVCDFDTRGRSEITAGGWGSEDEMCMSFFAYFPQENAQTEFCLNADSSESSAWSLTEVRPPDDRACFQSFSSSVGNFSMSWEFPEAFAGEIEIEFSLSGTQYIGLGLGSTGDPTGCLGMQDCDMIIGVASSNGLVVGDYWGDGMSTPSRDDEQSITVLEASVSGGRSSIRVRRALYTGDGKDAKLEISDQPTNIIYAWKNPTAAADAGLVFHGPGDRQGGHSIGQQGTIPVILRKCD